MCTSNTHTPSLILLIYMYTCTFIYITNDKIPRACLCKRYLDLIKYSWNVHQQYTHSIFNTAYIPVYVHIYIYTEKPDLTSMECLDPIKYSFRRMCTSNIHNQSSTVLIQLYAWTYLYKLKIQIPRACLGETNIETLWKIDRNRSPNGLHPFGIPNGRTEGM
jgi:hypothetical protein